MIPNQCRKLRRNLRRKLHKLKVHVLPFVSNITSIANLIVSYIGVPQSFLTRKIFPAMEQQRRDYKSHCS